MNKQNNLLYIDISNMTDNKYFNYINHILNNLVYDELDNVSNLYLLHNDIVSKCTSYNDVLNMIYSIVSDKQSYFITNYVSASDTASVNFNKPINKKDYNTMKENENHYESVISELFNSISDNLSKSPNKTVQAMLDNIIESAKDNTDSNWKSIFNHLNDKSEDIQPTPQPKYTPPYDVYETYDYYKLKILLPGISDKDSIKITFSNNTLSVSSNINYINDIIKPCNTSIINQTTNIVYPKSFNIKLKVNSLIDNSKILAELQTGILTIKLLKIKNSNNPIQVSIK